MKRLWIAAAAVGLLGLGAAAVLKRRCDACAAKREKGAAAGTWTPFDRAVRLQDDGKHAEAIPLYQEALRADPSDADARFNLGTALEASGRTEEALEAYLEVLKRQPGSSEAALAAAEAADALGRDEQALDLYHEHLGIVMRGTAPVRRRVETLERSGPGRLDLREIPPPPPPPPGGAEDPLDEMLDDLFEEPE